MDFRHRRLEVGLICRIGSLEICDIPTKEAKTLICRIGSLEIDAVPDCLVLLLICRIGSLETNSEMVEEEKTTYLPHRHLRNGRAEGLGRQDRLSAA